MKVPATFAIEQSLWRKNKKLVVGIDEVGRGAWAGPLVAAAVIFPKEFKTKTLFFDSKLLTAKEREDLTTFIKEKAVCFGIGQSSPEEIAQFGLTVANQLAFERAAKNLSHRPDHYLLDAFYIKSLSKTNQTPLLNGDFYSASIAAASIIAKVFRDNLMTLLARDFPNYGFETNKGYGTKVHQTAIKTFGLTSVHRTNYNLKFLSN